MNQDDLFDCSFPGRKSGKEHKALIQYIGNLNPGYVCEPFAGTGQLTQAMWNLGIPSYIGESDPLTRAVWRCWMSGEEEQDKCIVKIQKWQDDFKLCPDVCWSMLLECMALDSYCLWDGDEDPSTLAALKLIYQKLAIGGIFRRNKKGKINVGMDYTKLKSFLSWDYRFPTSIQPIMVSVKEDWRKAIYSLPHTHSVGMRASTNPGVIWIDPPYITPSIFRGTKLTPTYDGHKPESLSCLRMTIDSLELAMENLTVGKIFLTNYYCPQLDTLLIEYANRNEWKIASTKWGKLNSLGSQLQSKEKDDDCQSPREAIWEFTSVVPMSYDPCRFFDGGKPFISSQNLLSDPKYGRI